jgi:hypothetical protein
LAVRIIMVMMPRVKTSNSEAASIHELRSLKGVRENNDLPVR